MSFAGGKMNQIHTDVYTDICCSTKLDAEVLDELISKFILTFEDREDVLHQSSQRERNETLLDILSSRPYDTTAYLAEALGNCNRHELSNRLTLSTKKEIIKIENELDVLFTQNHAFKLQKHFKNIVHNLDCTKEIMDYLMTQSTVTMEEKERICKDGITRQESNRQLLSVLMYQGKEGFSNFIAALNEDECCREIANDILATEISQKEMQLYQIGIVASREKKKIERTIPQNIREKIMTKLKKWKMDDQRFVATKASEYVLQCMHHEACVVVTGNSGCGKTFTAHHVALQMKEKGYNIVPIVKPEDITNYLVPNIKMLFVVDDLCGKFTVNQIELNEWNRVLNNLDEMENNNKIKILATCRLQVFRDERLQDLSLFQNCECNIISKELSMRCVEKTELAKRYFGDNIDKIKHLETYDFFPFLCQLYGRNSQIGIHSLPKNPFGILQEELNKLQRGDDGSRLKYCGLLICVLLSNTLQVDDFDKENDDVQQMIATTLKICRLNKGTQESSILDALKILENTYVTMEDGTIHIIHDKLYDFLAKYFGEKHTVLFLQCAHPLFLKERFAVHDSEICNNDLIKLKSEHIKPYIERLITKWKELGIGFILGNENLKSERFFGEFFSHVKKLPQYQIKNLVNQQVDNTIPLVEASKFGTTNIVRWMLSIRISSNCLYYEENDDRREGDSFLDVNVCDSNGMSPLYTACYWKGNLNTVIELLKQPSLDVNLRNSMGWFPLYVTCYTGNVDVLKELLKHPMLNINLCDEDGWSPLYAACYRGNFETVVELLKQPSIDVNLSDSTGCTPLYAACSHGNVEIAIELLKCPSLDVNFCDNDGCSPLYAACLNGNTDTVIELLKMPFLDVNLTDGNRSSPLFAASYKGNADTVLELLKHPTLEVNLCDYDGCSPLYAACFNSNSLTVKELLKHPSLNVNLCERNGGSPLFVACSWKGNVDKVKELLTHPLLDPNICNKRGQSPLHAAVENVEIDTITELLKHPSINTNIVDEDGCSPLNYAYKQDNIEIINLLKAMPFDFSI